MREIGYKAATTYGYSNARVKAMESKLLDQSFMNQIAKSENVASAMGLLLQTDYKTYVDQFGGMNVEEGLVDFALSKSLEENSHKLINLTPKDDRQIIARLVSRSDAQNMKLVFYAKINNKSFDEISRYIIESQNIDYETVKRALNEQTLEETATKLMVRSPYRKVIEEALKAYRESSNITELNAAIDMGFFRLLAGTIKKLSQSDHESATIAKMDIEMRNILVLIRAKKYNLDTSKLRKLLVEKGITSIESLMQIFESSKDVHELAEKVSSFDLKKALESYEKGKGRQMLLFEISMRNQIFRKAISLLRHSTLSFSVIMGYFYLKEIEVFTLRILINGKSYGLTQQEIEEMGIWQQ